MRFVSAICVCCLMAVFGVAYAEAKPIEGFGPKIDNEPVLINPLQEDSVGVDQDLIEQLRARIRALDENIGEKLAAHDGSRPRQYFSDNMPELDDAKAERDLQWQAFMEAASKLNAKQQQVDILDKPDKPLLGKQEKMLIAVNQLEAAECYRELNQHGDVNLEELRRSAIIAKEIDIDDLPVNERARLLYLRCVLSIDRSRWESEDKRAGFLAKANKEFQLLKTSHPNSLLTTNASHLLLDDQIVRESDQ